MILDSFKLQSIVFQLQYAEALEIWDRAGEINRRLMTIWPGAKVIEGTPQRVSLRAQGVQVQTGLLASTASLSGENPLDARRVRQLDDTFKAWRELLELTEVKRISMRARYTREFSSLKEANAELLALNVVKWPAVKVFDQPTESDLNGFELLYRFEDASSFTLVQMKAEQLKFEADLDPYFVEEPEIRRTKNRLFIDFDRGLLGAVNTEKFRMEDWIKGFQHILRRDIDKVLRP